MEKDFIKHHLKIMGQTLMEMEQTDFRLLSIEKELVSIRAFLSERIKIYRSSLCVLLGYLSADEEFETQSRNLQLNSAPLFLGNEYQEIISKPTQEIVKEIEKMIIELKIKGSVREHKNGLIKFHSTTLGSIYGRTEEEIKKKLQEKLKQFKKTSNTDKIKEKKKIPLFSEFYRKNYLPYKIKEGISKSTIDGYENNVRFIIKQKFDKPLNWYKSQDIVDFLHSFPQTRKRQIMQGFLNNLFKRAITAAYIKINPCATIEKVKHKQEQGTSFSFVELKEFLQILFNHQHLSYADKCYFIFVFLTGTRREEARQLTTKDADFQNKVLHIPGTKTEGSDRNIPLTPIVEKLLLSLKVTKGSYFKMHEYQADILFRKVWKKEKGHKLHDLRHTFGTLKICAEKIEAKTVSLLMGHSTVDTTLNRYTHPEQLDKGTFFNGGLSDEEKIVVYKSKYDEIIRIINDFIG